MVEVYIADTSQMKEDISFYRDALRPERWERANRFVFLKDRLLCVAAGMLLREVLGVTQSEAITKNKYGKPVLAAGGVEFNLSHSGRFCVLAVGDAPLGVDIERVSGADGAVAEKCYTKSELAYLYKKSSGQEERFAILWTRKESLMKATGMGFNLPPARFCVVPMGDGPFIMNEKVWYFKQYDPDAAYKMTVCAQQADYAPGLRWMRL